MAITSVELISFTAINQNRDGILIQWQTGREIDNAGFYVLRSRSENGNYEKINKSIIQPALSHKYELRDRSVRSGERYYYKLKDVSVSGNLNQHGPVAVTAALPTAIVLHQNYPNPFNPTTSIAFDLPKTQYVRLEIFNLAGQRVQTLIDDDQPAGFHSVVWNGTDDAGNLMPSAIYYYRLQVGDFARVKKLMLLK